MSIRTKTIVVLGDGKLKAITTKNKTIYMQPTIVVDRLSETITVKGMNDGENVDTDTNITSIDGVAFSGDMDALDTALREMAAKANGILNAGGGGGSTITTTSEQADILNIGYSLDLAADDGGDWSGFPLTFQGATGLNIVIGLNGFVYPSTEVVSDIDDLVLELNNLQSLIVFAKLDDTNLLLSDGTERVEDITTIEFDVTPDFLEYTGPYTELAAVPLSVFHQIHEQQKTMLAYQRAILDSVKSGILSTNTSVPASGTVVNLHLASSNRIKIVVTNNGTGVLYIKEGTGASLTSFAYVLTQNQSKKIDDYTGVITGIWTAPNGTAQITETT